MLPFSFYNIKSFKNSCHQAELGGSLGLKLLLLICKSSTADAAMFSRGPLVVLSILRYTGEQISALTLSSNQVSMNGKDKCLNDATNGKDRNRKLHHWSSFQ